MKKLLSIMLLLAGVISFTSCGDDDITYTAPAQLSLKSADAFYEAAGGTGSIVVNSNESITATSNADWLSVSVSGNTVNLTVSANDKLEGRSTNVVLKSPTASKEVNITQRGIIYGVGNSLFQMADIEGATISIPVAQTAGVSVVSLTEWLTASFNSTTSAIELMATSNDEEKARYGFVALQTGTVKDTLIIAQNGMIFNLEKTTVDVTEKGGVETVTIEHSKPVTVESAPEWIECVFNDETDTLTMTIGESSVPTREGTISLTSGKSTKTITVVQKKSESTEPQHTFADEVYGQYIFVYYDAIATQDWAYFDAEITEKGLTFYYPVTDTVILPYTVPLEIDNANRQVKAGPNGSFLGMYGSDYYIYLGWYNMDAGLSGFGDSGIAIGTLSSEEDEGELITYLDWGGTFGDNTIDGWVLQAFAASEYSEGNYAGALDYLIAPYMIKVDEGEEPAAVRHRAHSARVINSRNHKVNPAKFNSNGLLKKMK